MLKPEGFYIWVDNLDEAIDFYEQVFGMEIVNREGNRWADFGDDKPVRMGIFNYTVDDEKVKIGHNLTPELRARDINEAYKLIKSLKPESISKITTLKQPVLYRYFQFEDKWGNVWEVAEHEYN